MKKSNLAAMIAAMVAIGLVGGCASSNALSSGDSNQTGPVTTVAADPMGAAIFGGTPQQDGNPDIAIVDTK